MGHLAHCCIRVYEVHSIFPALFCILLTFDICSIDNVASTKKEKYKCMYENELLFETRINFTRSFPGSSFRSRILAQNETPLCLPVQNCPHLDLQPSKSFRCDAHLGFSSGIFSTQVENWPGISLSSLVIITLITTQRLINKISLMFDRGLILISIWIKCEMWVVVG